MKFLLVLLLGISSAFAADLTVNITGHDNDRGNINIAIWDNARDWSSKANEYDAVIIPASESQAVFRNLRPGTYAIAIYHDKNSNGRLNTNFMGIPTEEFGFSTNPGFITGHPSFRSVSFTFNSSTSISINLRKVL